eukprot:6295840-Karenia_brevis.AAC.1
MCDNGSLTLALLLSSELFWLLDHCCDACSYQNYCCQNFHRKPTAIILVRIVLKGTAAFDFSAVTASTRLS